jgi:hypothetical protein
MAPAGAIFISQRYVNIYQCPLYFGFLYLGGHMHWSLHQLLMVVILSGLILRIDKMFDDHQWKHRWKWLILIVVFGFSGFSDQRGWPAKIDVTDDFVYISGVVQPPTPHNDGKIFIWVRLKTNPELPFAIELEYDSELEKRINLANMQSILNGEMSVDMTQFKEVTTKKVYGFTRI